MEKHWYSIGTYEQIRCISCDENQEGVISLDHHLRQCPNCKVKCIWYDLGNKKGIQVIPSYAPAEIQTFIKWGQRELDELEFFNLVMAFETLGKEMHK